MISKVYWNMKVSGYRNFIKVYNERVFGCLIVLFRVQSLSSSFIHMKSKIYNYWESKSRFWSEIFISLVDAVCPQSLLRDGANTTIRDSFCHFLSFSFLNLVIIFWTFIFWDILSDMLHTIIETLRQSVQYSITIVFITLKIIGRTGRFLILNIAGLWGPHCL